MAISPGTYTVQFKTPVGDGAGEVEFSPDGRLRGGDATFAYDGSWSQEGERFKAALSARRVVSGPPGVFGMDQVDIVVTGRSDGSPSIRCTGFARQTPGLKLEVVLTRLS